MISGLHEPVPRGGRWARWTLPAIVLLAFVVRTLGPLREAALGQSDAYGHLQFLNDLLITGRLRHPFYPAGYYWLLAAPAYVFNLDTYLVARFSGSFFGAGLVAGLYLLARAAFGRPAALWSAFLAAAFPAFYLLQKTGVGAFPNQLGLALVPVLLWAWDRVLCRRWQWLGVFLAASAALAGSVPMMLLDLLPLLALDFGVRLVRREVARSTWLALAAAGAALMGGMGWMLWRGGAARLVQTAVMISGVTISTDSPALALLRIIGAYVVPQRFGPGGFLLQAGAWCVGAVLAVLLWKLWYRGAAARMLALWAIVAWAQTVFCVFQFALYLRAGWMLLAAMAALGGWIVHETLVRLPVRVRQWSACALAGSACLVLAYPPTPAPQLSPAESDLIIVARQIAKEADPSRPLAVWSRTYTGFCGHQGDPLYALLERRPGIVLHIVRPTQTDVESFDPTMRHLVVLDDRVAWTRGIGVMRWVNPGMIRDFMDDRDRLMAGAGTLRRRMEAAIETGSWRVERGRCPQGLEWIRLDPAGPHS